MALFEAHTRFIDKTVARVSKALKKETGVELNDEMSDSLKRLISLKMQDRQRVNTDALLKAVQNDTIDSEIAALQGKTYFSDDQIRNIEQAAKDRGSIAAHDQIFEGQDRCYFRIQATGVGKIQQRVEDFLSANGYTVLDYQTGIATEAAEDRHGKQQFKIGRLLKDNEALLKSYSEDPIRGIGNLMVVMSRDPMDIAKMSTNRGWRSCMSHDGFNFRYVYDDIRQGTVVSYLTSMTDPMIHDPLSRVSLKPFTRVSKDFGQVSSHGQDDVIFRAGPSYGIPNAIFVKALMDYAKIEMNAGRVGTYEMARGLYGDGMKKRVRRSGTSPL
jgi:hypothetical protein